MKQIKAVALSLAVCAVLSSCGSKEAASSAGAKSQAASSAVSSESVSSEQAAGESTIPDNMKFNFTCEKFLKDLNARLVGNGSSEIAERPEETKTVPVETFSGTLYNLYSASDGVDLYISYDPADNKTVEVLLDGKRENMNDSDKKQYKACIDSIEQKMAGSEATSVEQQLNTDNMEKPFGGYAISNHTGFCYEVTDEKISFCIVTEDYLLYDEDETGSSALQASSKKEFSMTLDRFVQSVNSQLTKDKYSALPEPSKQESDFPGFGKANRYEYAAGDGVKLVVYADPENSNVLNILYNVDTGKVTKQSKEYYEQCAGITLAYLDREEAPGVAQKLDIDNTAKDRVATASSSKCSYSLIISGGSISLSIEPNK